MLLIHSLAMQYPVLGAFPAGTVQHAHPGKNSHGISSTRLSGPVSVFVQVQVQPEVCSYEVLLLGAWINPAEMLLEWEAVQAQDVHPRSLATHSASEQVVVVLA